jgi:phytoene synthase
MQFQIQRARKFYNQAERGIGALNEDARWPVWSALMLYSRILNAIENNNYDNFNQRAYVPGVRKMSLLPISWLRATVL